MDNSTYILHLEIEVQKDETEGLSLNSGSSFFLLFSCEVFASYFNYDSHLVVKENEVGQPIILLEY